MCNVRLHKRKILTRLTPEYRHRAEHQQFTGQVGGYNLVLPEKFITSKYLEREEGWRYQDIRHAHSAQKALSGDKSLPYHAE